MKLVYFLRKDVYEKKLRPVCLILTTLLKTSRYLSLLGVSSYKATYHGAPFECVTTIFYLNNASHIFAQQ